MSSTSADIMRRVEKLERAVSELKGGADAKPHGCVCPVGAEKTCKGWDCPRRQHDTTFR